MRHSEKREYPRQEKRLVADVFRRGGRKTSEDYSFTATMNTHDISAGGMFLESTFFLPEGTQYEVEFELPHVGFVSMDAEVVHVLNGNNKSGKPNGFASRFTNFYEDSEVALRAFLMHNDLVKFVRKELKGKKRSWNEENLVELIVRWEMTQEEQDRQADS